MAGQTALVGALLALGGCGSPPRAPVPGAGVAPATQAAPDLPRVPDAWPQLEPIRIGGPNKPYEVDGRLYVPLTTDSAVRETGLASWYGYPFHGRGTASGERYDMYAMTAAHRTMPLPSFAKVRNPANGREVIVRVNDRGPFVTERVIDLSYTAAWKLGLLGAVAPVEVERITFDDIRTGAWRDRAGARPVAARSDGADPLGDWLRRLDTGIDSPAPR